jgi:ABC-type dipeptide/oligopeptide/nickel transport system permease subunit
MAKKFSFTIITVWFALCLYSYFCITAPGIELSQRLTPPGSRYFLGTNHLGQSLLVIMIYSLPVSLGISLMTALFCVILGIIVGSLGGLKSGIIKEVIDRIMDIFISFPPLVLPLVIYMFMGARIEGIILALTLSHWVPFAKLIQNQMQVLKYQPFAVASKALGSSEWRVWLIHLLPQCITPMILQISLSVPSFILSETALSFLGLGLERESIGTLLSDGRLYLFDAPYLVIFPSLLLLLIVVAWNTLGESFHRS